MNHIGIMKISPRLPAKPESTKLIQQTKNMLNYVQLFGKINIKYCQTPTGDIMLSKLQTLLKIKENKKNNTAEKAPHWSSLLIFYYISILWLEVVLRTSSGSYFGGQGLIYISLLSFSVAIFLFTITSVFSETVNKIIAFISLSIITLVFLIQIVYRVIFSTYLTVYVAVTGTKALGFTNIIASGIHRSIPPIVLSLMPILVMALLGKKRLFKHRLNGTSILISLIAIFVSNILCLYSLAFSGSNYGSAASLYFNTSNVNLSMNRLGLITTTRLDIQRQIFGFEEKRNIFDESDDETDSEDKQSSVSETDMLNQPFDDEQFIVKPASPKPNTPQYNVLDIDFGKLIDRSNDSDLTEMHEYFMNQQPTEKNAKTGIFEGNNLIFVTAESFAPYAISEEKTPTLYKMMNEGYNFTNFYNPLWMGSTLAGEYAICSGLLPKYGDGVMSFHTMENNNFYYALGNQMNRLGYLSYAFHANTFDYYGRDRTHPSMGYSYFGTGNGLELENPHIWPQSDLELIEASTDFYLGKDKPFHAYYMTVSGHCAYDFNGNMMAYKNMDAVSDMDLSEGSQAYIACNIELDRAMEELLKRLEEAGIAENTVIAITPDHYPYELPEEQINELLGYEVEEDYELYKSCFFIYKKGMTPEVIDKPCSTVDILPTLSNLFGTEFDSRLMSGRDIFSNADPIVFFMGHKWLTDKASFDPDSKEFLSLTDEKVDEEYQERISGIVSNRFNFAAKILDYDYYNLLFKNQKQ